MSARNRSLCDPAKRCPRCDAMCVAFGIWNFQVTCGCGLRGTVQRSPSAACDAWDRGEYENPQLLNTPYD